MTEKKEKCADCAPTLTDSQVLEFCKRGYILFKGVVPDEINRMTTQYCDQDDYYEPTDILKEDWFIDNVILNQKVAGAVRSLLGRDFHLPILMSNHRMMAPYAQQNWHVDGNFDFGHELNYLQVFYYPQDTPLEMGPTQILPGSHLVRNMAKFMAHLGGIAGTVSATAPAGSIFITAYQIWHRRGPATAEGMRNMLKYFYWRTTPPLRDWIVEEDFDFATVDYASPIETFVEQFRSDIKVAKMFLWLCGEYEKFQNLGGQSWPLPAHRNDTPYGFPEGLPKPVKNSEQ